MYIYPRPSCSWSFICKSWLSVREDDGRIKRQFPELNQDPRYNIHIRGLSNGVFKRHLVGAVFTKHSRSKYTCAQRVGILFMMFYLIMVNRICIGCVFLFCYCCGNCCRFNISCHKTIGPMWYIMINGIKMLTEKIWNKSNNRHTNQ